MWTHPYAIIMHHEDVERRQRQANAVIVMDSDEMASTVSEKTDDEEVDVGKKEAATTKSDRRKQNLKQIL